MHLMFNSMGLLSYAVPVRGPPLWPEWQAWRFPSNRAVFKLPIFSNRRDIKPLTPWLPILSTPPISAPILPI